MLKRFSEVVFTIGLFYMLPTAASLSENVQHVAPSIFPVSLLINPMTITDFGTALSTTGLIAVELDERFQKARQVALNGLCQCAQSPDFLQMEGTDAAKLLSDASTTRTTFATATVGNTPLSLHQEALERTCGIETAEHMELLRDYVAHASSAFITALDRLLVHPGENPLLRTIQGAEYTSIHSIVKASTNLEHFHVYSKHPSASDVKVLDLHTDAGLFLTFVPGLSCTNKDENSHFYIQGPNGVLQQVVFPPRSVGIMLGAGSQHWLDTIVPLRATQHAVHMQPGETRAWYGMMHLVPQNAIVQQDGAHTFRDLQRAMSSTLEKDVAIGCGTASLQEETAESSLELSVKRRRRLQHITNGSSCNNVTNFFCWMTCQEIPDIDNVQENINQGKSLYCVEPAVLASSGVSGAVDSCTEIGVVGGAMNEACVGSWQPTVEGVTSQQILVDISTDQLDEPFCYGGTSMYMDGFQWIDTTCVIYLFPEWVLKTPAAIVGACIGTLAFGIALEGVIFTRRKMVQSMPAGWRQVGVSTLIYGVQLTMGYMLMLVVMTYSGPLFLCVVVGLMLGHLCFNSKILFGKYESLAHPKMDDSCCRTNQVESGTSSEVDCCGRESGTDSNITPCVPEGSTPCCQNTL